MEYTVEVVGGVGWSGVRYRVKEGRTEGRVSFALYKLGQFDPSLPHMEGYYILLSPSGVFICMYTVSILYTNLICGL